MIRAEHDDGRRGRLVLSPTTATEPTTADYFIEVVDRPSQLARFVADWEELAANAVEPNPFYEPFMLLPALEAYAGKSDLRFAFVYRRKAIRANGPPVMIGFFPLERKRRYKSLPIRLMKLYEYMHCFLDTPLIRDGFGKECLDTFFEWAQNDPHGAPVIEMGQITAEGPFQHLLIDHCNTHQRLSYIDERHSRALFRRDAKADDFLNKALTTKLRKELRRQKKRLAEGGTLELRQLQSSHELSQWLQQFRELEHCGWKGAQGTSFQATQTNRVFFDAMGTAAFERGRLMMLGLFLNDRPIAMKFNLMTPPGSFSFKIAYDESLSKFSPGVLLELENINELHDVSAVEWMDSCAIAEHSMINRLWKDRRAIQTILVSTGKIGGDLLVSGLPMLRWLKRFCCGRASRPR